MQKKRRGSPPLKKSPKNPTRWFRIREALGIGQAEMAALVGATSRDTIRDYENGRTPPPMRRMAYDMIVEQRKLVIE